MQKANPYVKAMFYKLWLSPHKQALGWASSPPSVINNMPDGSGGAVGKQSIWWHLPSHTWLILEPPQTQCITHTHTQTPAIALEHQQTPQNQPSAFWSLNSTQATTANFLRDNPLGRTGLWNPIKKLTSLVLATILSSLRACGFWMLETVRRGGHREKTGFRTSWWTAMGWGMTWRGVDSKSMQGQNVIQAKLCL